MGNIKHISQHVSAQQTRSAPTSSATTGVIPRKWVDALFAKFMAIWPRDWADRVSLAGADAMAQEWAEGLAGMTAEQMRSAIEHCRNTMKWAPSIAEFREASAAGMTQEQRAFKAQLESADAARRALPSRTWADRRADGQRQAREMLAMLNTGVAPQPRMQESATAEEDEPVTQEQIERIESAKRDAAAAIERMKQVRGDEA